MRKADHRSMRAGSRGWPKRESCPLVATFLILSRSRGAFGRVRATPGGLPAAGRSTDGAEGARTDPPGTAKRAKE